jgi:transposase
MTEDEVRQVLKEYKVVKGHAVNVIELAKRYGVSQCTIKKLVSKYCDDRA